MPNYLSPGVYVEEVQAASRPIEGSGRPSRLRRPGAARACQHAADGHQLDPVRDHVRRLHEGSYLAHAVYGFFLNGGTTAYVVRIGADGADGAPTARLELPSSTDKGQAAFRVVALEAGAAGNDVSVEVVTRPSRARASSSWS